MSGSFGFRLCLDLIAAALLVFGLAYWWLGDGPHEFAGLCLFGLVTAHNVFNRRWYRVAARGRIDAARWFSLVATGVLALSMLALAITSAAITTATPSLLSPGAEAVVKRLHILAAYWAFVAVAVHLGLRWPMLMARCRHALGLARVPWWLTVILRLAALAIGLQGVRSFAALGIGDRLSMRMLLDWWDFDAAVWDFFAHCAAAAGLLMAISYYGTRLLRSSFMNGMHQRNQS